MEGCGTGERHRQVVRLVTPAFLATATAASPRCLAWALRTNNGLARPTRVSLLAHAHSSDTTLSVPTAEHVDALVPGIWSPSEKRKQAAAGLQG